MENAKDGIISIEGLTSFLVYCRDDDDYNIIMSSIIDNLKENNNVLDLTKMEHENDIYNQTELYSLTEDEDGKEYRTIIPNNIEGICFDANNLTSNTLVQFEQFIDNFINIIVFIKLTPAYSLDNLNEEDIKNIQTKEMCPPIVYSSDNIIKVIKKGNPINSYMLKQSNNK